MKERSLRDLFHLVKQVLPDEQEIKTVPPTTKVREALQLMRKYNFSQVPVVQGNEVLGVFSYRSLTQRLSKLPEKERDPLVLPVEEFLEDLKFARITDELRVLFEEFGLKDAVLVGNETRLQGVVTSFDALKYFYRVASPYVLLREIELAIRELIRASVTEDEFLECVKITLGKHSKATGRSLPASVEEMTFHDYVMLLRYQDIWCKFSDAFGGTPNLVNTKLKPLPELRNDVFHFRRELTAEEYDLLRDCRDWLLTRIRMVEASKKDA
ncbi:CBS domain-containing protein [Acidobacteria bacterium AH-259-L09]|nr:CBS domain-containing protein [Acidobacteria bacterium AH-259-L09]